MPESSDTSNSPAKPHDYAGLRAELSTLANDFSTVITERWPRLEDHKYRWELHSYGLPEGYDKSILSDIIALLAPPITTSYTLTLKRPSTILPAPTESAARQEPGMPTPRRALIVLNGDAVAVKATPLRGRPIPGLDRHCATAHRQISATEFLRLRLHATRGDCSG